MRRKPFPFQLKGVRKLHHFNGRALLADDMGLGKTFQALLYASQTKSRPILVICPASVKWHWEIEALATVGIVGLVLSGQKPFRKGTSLKHNLVIINYDILRFWQDWLMEQNFEVVILDECHKLGNRHNKWTKSAKALCQGVDRIIGLSGTPMQNRPAELFTMLNILRPDIFPSFFSFGFRYCEPRKRPWGWEFKGATRMKELNRLLNTHCMIRRRKKDVLKDLPAKTRIIVPLEISDKARKEYNAAEKDFIGWLTKKAPHLAKSAQKAEKLTKLGYLKRLAANLKLPQIKQWIDEFLEDTDEKLILFGIHKAFLGELKQKYGRISTFIDGSVTGINRQRAIEKFTNNSKVRMMLGNLKAAGVGWNGTAAGAGALAELGWHPAEMIQAEDRGYRIGQKKAYRVYYLVARGTVEEDLCVLHQSKQEVFNAIIEGKKRAESFDLFSELEKSVLDRSRKCRKPRRRKPAGGSRGRKSAGMI